MKQNSNNQLYSRLASETFLSLNNDNKDKLVAEVRDQVTSYLFNRVSEQITMLESQSYEMNLHVTMVHII